MKKIITTSIFLASCFLVQAQVTHVTVQVSKSIKSLVEVQDWADIIANGVQVVQRTENCIERFKIVQQHEATIKSLLKGKGYGVYRQYQPSEANKILSRIQFTSMEVSANITVYLSIYQMVTKMGPEIVKAAYESIGENVNVASDGVVFLGTGGGKVPFTAPDHTPVVNAVNSISFSSTKESLKKRILETTSTLTMMDQALDRLYELQMDYMKLLERLNEMGMAIYNGSKSSTFAPNWATQRLANIKDREVSVQVAKARKSQSETNAKVADFMKKMSKANGDYQFTYYQLNSSSD